MKRFFIIAIMAVTVAILLSSQAVAGQIHGGNGQVVNLPQDPSKNPRLSPRMPSPQQWGTTLPSISQISAFQFVPYDSTMTLAVSNDNMRYKTNAGDPSWVRATTNLPSGVKVEGIEVYGCDDDPTSDSDLYAWFVICTSGTCTWYGDNLTNGSPSCDYFYYDLSSANITIDNVFSNYFVEVKLSTNNDTNRFQSFNIYYSRQISPPPSTPTFSDVPTAHPFYQEIEALAASGITTGYPDGTFRPNNYVTRQSMAAFLSRALGLFWEY